VSSLQSLSSGLVDIETISLRRVDKHCCIGTSRLRMSQVSRGCGITYSLPRFRGRHQFGWRSGAGEGTRTLNPNLSQHKSPTWFILGAMCRSGGISGGILTS
jgi:hypothetical protein